MTDDPIDLAAHAPEGWHEDPERPGYLRYWNGSEWTEQRKLAPPTPPSPQKPQAGPPAPEGWHADPTRPGYLRYWTGSEWVNNWKPAPRPARPSALPANGAAAPDDRLGLGLAGLGALLAVIGVFLPHLNSTTFARIADNTLIQSGDGWIVLGLALGAVFALYSAYQGRGNGTIVPIVCGLGLIGLAIYEGTGSRTELQSTGPFARSLGLSATSSGSPGVGLYVVGIGGALLVIGGLVLRPSSRAR